jgi:hypothetical protein
MSTTKKSDIKLLDNFTKYTLNKNKYDTEMEQVIELFKERKIATSKHAVITIEQLASNNKKSNILGLKILDMHNETPSLTGRLTKNNKPQTYGHMNQGSVDTTTTYGHRKMAK